MGVPTDPTPIRVYTVNGAVAGSSSALPDWLTRKRAAASRGKRAIREHYQGTIELLQDFEFPESSTKIKTSRDGHFAMATGVYKPQIRVYDLDQLTLKFERHSDAENVDFVMLSDDWTKSIHLQSDRSVEVHTQGGFHYRTRIPRFGRTINYHFPSCDAFVGGTGNEVYRLNLEQGRFLSPLQLTDDGDAGGGVEGVNVIDINPAHHLLAFGLDGAGSVQFWDPRSRSRVGTLRLPSSLASSTSSILLPGVEPLSSGQRPFSVTALSSKSDGLSYAVGTSTGHTLLYDIRSPRPVGTKDQGYGLAIKSVYWLEGSRVAGGDGLVLSADSKVIKIWNREEPSSNFVSIPSPSPINHVHHVPGSGLIMLANEAIKMSTFFVPQLGPAPKWCSFLENVTEEMEDTGTRTAYQDFKFVERAELGRLGLDNLIGTPAIKPYMHGYFMSLKLYDTARSIADPMANINYRERLVKEKMEKLSEARIRTAVNANQKKKGMEKVPKVNLKLAEKVKKAAEKEARKAKKRDQTLKVAQEAEGEEGEEEEEGEKSLLTDTRFSALFSNPAFQIDEASREYALLNPSAAAQKKMKQKEDEVSEEDGGEGGSGSGEDEGDFEDLEGDGDEEMEVRDGDEDEDEEMQDWEDEDDEDEGPRRIPARDRQLPSSIRMVPTQAHMDVPRSSLASSAANAKATFGQRRLASSKPNKSKGATEDEPGVKRLADGSVQFSFVPSTSAERKAQREAAGSGKRHKEGEKKGRRKGVETFGAGMERRTADAFDNDEAEELGGDRKGRTNRRRDVRSASRNVFRRM